MKKTNAQRVLEAQGIAYTTVEYDESGQFHSGEEVARILGVEPELVFKTLVVRREPAKGKALLVMMPVNRDLELRQLASQIGEKKLRMAKQHEAEQLTGLQVGGISALPLLNRGFAVFIDRSALDHDEIHISGGQRGVDICLKVADLMRVTNSVVVDATGGRDSAQNRANV